MSGLPSSDPGDTAPDLSVSSDVPPGLPELRAQLDAIDRAIIDLLARRLDVCRAVARAKERSNARIIVPQRVRDVWNSRRRWAAAVGVDPDFGEQMFRTLLAETHRIESAEADRGREQHRPPAEAEYGSALQLAACRVDHLSLRVADVGAAESFLTASLGFRRERVHPRGEASGVTLVAGGVTLVVMAAPAQAPELDDGRRSVVPEVPGIDHFSIEVLDTVHARDDLAARGCEVGDVRTDEDGNEEFFVARDPASGLRVSIFSRTGLRGVPDGSLIG